MSPNGSVANALSLGAKSELPLTARRSVSMPSSITTPTIKKFARVQFAFTANETDSPTFDPNVKLSWKVPPPVEWQPDHFEFTIPKNLYFIQIRFAPGSFEVATLLIYPS